MDRTAVFIGTNPCNGDLVKAEGKRHDKFSLSFSATGSHSDHHINDSFKSIEVTPAGAAAPDPDIEYVGGDVHYDKFFVDVVDGKVTHRELTNERLNRRGGGDHWVLHVLQKTVFDADQFPNGTPASVELKGHASCPDKTHCTLPDGCPEQAFSLVTPPPPAP